MSMKSKINKMTCKLEDKEEIQKLAIHHIDSFNYAMKVVLKKLPKYMKPLEIKSNEKTEKIFKSMTIIYLDFDLGYYIY
jgi:hypothetical protein